MTKLKCSAKRCMYNAEDCCCKSDIKVEGREAEDTEDTCCGSFQDRGCNCGKNAMDSVNYSVDVKCEAESCIYNEHKQCTASTIGIAGPKACHSEETECASFRSK